METYIESGLTTALDGANDETAALVRSVDRLLSHADVRRRLAIRSNADTAEDAARARKLGAEGIGLCRTEHMFLGDRRSLIERVILAGTVDERTPRWTRCCRCSARTSPSCWRRWTGCR